MSPPDPAAPAIIAHDFALSARGRRPAHVWRGAHVALLIEAGASNVETLPAPRPVRLAVLKAFDAIFLAFCDVTGFAPRNICIATARSLLPVDVPLDNAGAGGLAAHGVAGISVGAELVAGLVARWGRAVSRHGVGAWMPAEGRALRAGATVRDLRMGGGLAVPEEAAVDQVFFYELNRNFWPPRLNRKFDWACNGDPSCWGWWTVGMNNAMAVILPDLLNMPMYYFGQSRRQFRDRMVANLDEYRRFCQDNIGDGFDAWTSSRMPWDRRESVNDLMSGLIIRSFERFGRETWIKGFYRAMNEVDDINESEAGGFDFQGARDNVFRVWSRAAGRDLYCVFSEELKWRISDVARAEMQSLYERDMSFSLDISGWKES